MLHPTKSRSIMQWFNSMATKGAIESLTQFSDGKHFYDIVAGINSLQTGKRPDASVNCSDNLVNDSSSSIVSTTEAVTDTQPINDEKNAEASSSAIEMSVDEEVQEGHKEPETNEEDSVSSSNKASNEGEIQKRYDAIKKFIDEFFKLDSISLISYSECINGKELELAKVAVLLLSAMVQSFLSSNNEQLYTTTLLDIQVQEDIKECLSLVLIETSVEDGTLKKTELQKVLSRPSKSKGIPRRTSNRGTSEVLETPDSKTVPKKRRERVTVIAEEVYESPMKSLLESPKIQFKAAMFRKDSEICKLKGDLIAEEEKVQNLTIEKSRLNVELNKKKRELQFLKEEHRKLQNFADEVDTSVKIELEKTLAENERCNKKINDLKVEMKILEKENEDQRTEIARLEEQLSHKRNTEEIDYKHQNDVLANKVEKLNIKVEEKEQEIDNLQIQVTIKEEDVKSYRNMHEDMAENKSNSDDSFDRHKLEIKIQECEDLKTKLQAAKRKIEELKGLERDRLGLFQNLQSLQNKLSKLQSDSESAQKQLKIYENWSNSIRNLNILNMNGDEMASRNPPESLSASTVASTSLDGFEREQNIKEEDTSSGKSMETRSACKQSITAYQSLSYSESEFLDLKRKASTIAKALTKKCDAAEGQHLTNLEEQARNLSSVNDVCKFHQSVLDTLKFVKPAVLPLNQKEFKIQLKAKDSEIKAAEDRCEELEINIKELNDNLVKSQQDATEANKKCEFMKKYVENVKRENNKLVKVCKRLQDDAGPKVEPCKECKLLHNALSDVKQEKKDFERDSAELKALVRDMESKNRNLERQLKNEMKERKKLEFQIQRESAFLSGSMSERNAVIHRYFQQGLAESKKAKLRAENERKSRLDQPQQVVSFNTYILNHDNKDPYSESSMSTTFANRSIRSGFLQTDDEEDFLNHSSLAQIHREVFPEPDDKRLTEIQRRNTLCLPHLQSSYPIELQNMTPTENKYFDKLRGPLQSFRKPLESTSEEVTYPEFEDDSEDSQDVQHASLRKRKFLEKEKIPMQPVKKIARSSSQVKLIQRVKPITPVRKTGFISKTKSFKTPTSIRRLMRMPPKNKKQ